MVPYSVDSPLVGVFDVAGYLLEMRVCYDFQLRIAEPHLVEDSLKGMGVRWALVLVGPTAQAVGSLYECLRLLQSQGIRFSVLISQFKLVFHLHSDGARSLAISWRALRVEAPSRLQVPQAHDFLHRLFKLLLGVPEMNRAARFL